MASTECVIPSTQSNIAQFKFPYIIDCNTNLAAAISKVMFVFFSIWAKFILRYITLGFYHFIPILSFPFVDNKTVAFYLKPYLYLCAVHPVEYICYSNVSGLKKRRKVT